MYIEIKAFMKTFLNFEPSMLLTLYLKFEIFYAALKNWELKNLVKLHVEVSLPHCNY